jgi:tape measure domain-containing protein
VSGSAVRSGQAFVEVGLRSKIKEGVRQIQNQLSAVSSGLRSFGSGLAAAGATATAAFGGIVAALAWPTKAAADLEQVRIQFEVMTGSASVAQGMLAEIQKFAAETPFEFPGLAKAAQTLLAYGVANERILPALKVLGDVSGGSQEKLERLSVAYGQVQAKGKLMAQEVNQMVESGFNPLQEISRTTGRSMGDLAKDMENGAISADMVTGAFLSATSEGGNFFRMMDKQSKTLLGRFGSLMDEINKALRPIGEELVKALKPVVEFAIALIKPIGAFITQNKQVATVIAAVAVAGTAVGIAMLTIGGTLVGLGAAVGGFAAALPAIVAGFGAIGTAIVPLLPVIAGVTLGVAALASLIYRVVDSAKQAGVLKEAFDGIAQTFGKLSSIASQTFSGIASALADGNITKAAAVLWAGLKVAFFTGAKASYDAFIWLFNNAGKLMLGFAKSIGTSLYNVFSQIPRLIKAAITGQESVVQILSAALTGNLGPMLQGQIESAQKELDSLTAKQSTTQSAKGAGRNPLSQPTGAQGPTDAQKAAAAAQEESKKTFDDRVKALREEAAEMRLGADAAELLKLRQQGLNDEQIRAIWQLQQQRNALQAQKKAQEEAKRKQEEAQKKADDQRKDLVERGKQMAEEVRTPFQVMRDKLAEINRLEAGGFVDKATAGLQREKAFGEFQQPMRDAMKSGRNNVAEINSQAAMDIVIRNQRTFGMGAGSPKKNPLEDYAREQRDYLKVIADQAGKGASGLTVKSRKI